MTMKEQSRLAPLSTPSRLRSARRRVAALLVVAWAFPGVWAVGHALAHGMEHESAGHFAAVAEGSVVAMAASHGHEHSHPDSPPVVSTGKAPEFEVPALLAAGPELECEDSPLRRRTRTAPARASPSTAAASGPRAPPLF